MEPTEDWDFYACRIDDHPASVFVDLGLRRIAPLATLPTQYLVRLPMLAARPDGLSSNAEYPTLCAIEDAFTAAIAPLDAQFVGRTTHRGFRTFYFYCADTTAVGRALEAAIAGFPSYAAQYYWADDAEWKTYLEFLHPSDRDRHLIQDRRTCDALEREGDVPGAIRKIDHWIYLPDEKAAAEFLSAARALGYDEEPTPARSTAALPCGVCISKHTSAEVVAVNKTTVELYELAHRYGGDYDGWESPVMASESSD